MEKVIRCPSCGDSWGECACVAIQSANAVHGVAMETMLAELKPLTPPQKLRWLASSMEAAAHLSATGQETPAAVVHVWKGTLEAMARGLDRAVRSGERGQPGNRAQRRAAKHLKRVK